MFQTGSSKNKSSFSNSKIETYFGALFSNDIFKYSSALFHAFINRYLCMHDIIDEKLVQKLAWIFKDKAHDG